MAEPHLDADSLVWLLPTERKVAGCCPHCDRSSELVVMRPDARAPFAVAHETLLRCDGCKRLAIPTGVLKRVLGLALMLPFAGVLLGALGTSLYLLAGMINGRAFDGGFAIVALILAGVAYFGGRPALRTLRRLLTPGSLLPLARSPNKDGPHLYRGDL